MNKKEMVTICLTALVLLALITLTLYFLPPDTFWVGFGVGMGIVAYYVVMLVVRGQRVREQHPRRWHGIFSLLGFFIIASAVFVFMYIYAVPSITTIVLMVALIFTLAINFLTVPLAIIHRHRERQVIESTLKEYPRVSIIVPAYNEEKVLDRTLQNLLEAYYPNKEIIVVDDGSVDDTYKIAKKYTARGVKVVQRANGGKYAALNTGLTYATGDFVITVDADSMVTRPAIVEIIKSFTDLDIGGVAGTLKVYNTNNYITRFQALEYLIQIEIVRRAFDNFGTITVAPGAFSAYRRSDLAGCGNYDPDRLLEDFDLTIKMQKAKRVLRGSSEALCYTEAPDNWRDVYRQRLSWYRGDFQNFWKHRDAFFNPKFGYMQALTLPYMLITMALVPLASIVVIATSILMLLNGDWQILLGAGAIFMALQFVLAVLAIQIGRDDMKLCIYAPLFIVGYKQFLDFVMVKALFDIILSRGHYLKRERVRRIGSSGVGEEALLHAHTADKQLQ